ncbi:uncharacterized protein [Montipora capricornis]|uniref:uncharacterized protein n=1 Tax=Montipora capricornis TaxID=246305 RepID=UPI0035F16F38
MALEQHRFPKSLKFRPPGNQLIFRRIMERASRHCMKARISICHDQIKEKRRILLETMNDLTPLISENTLMVFQNFLKMRAESVRSSIQLRHDKKLYNLRNEDNCSTHFIDKKNWVVNLSIKPLSSAERSLLEKGPKFAPTPNQIPYKNIVSEIEAAITHLPDEQKDSIRTSTAAILHLARLPLHKNITKEERKALKDLKKDDTRILMKADKGNCFVVLDTIDYNNKMNALLNDHNTYELVSKPPFRRIERELNNRLLTLKNQLKICDSTYRKLRSTDTIPPAIRGSIKHHKEGNPLRPIVSSIGSALYNTSKFLTNILTPLQNGNGFSVPNSSKFVDEISNIDIQDDEIMLSFDVVSLFTAIPVKKACDYIKNKLDCDESLHLRTKLDTTDIISLLNFGLSNNYFVYNDSVYKQIHGCAMGSPVSPMVANLCMEAIEEMAINTTPVPPKVWKRYVDDSFCIIKRNAVDSFHNTLNSIDQHISFTIEEENNNQIAFLDALVTRKDNDLIIGVYRKPTHTDRYLDFFSHHDKRHKTSTAETLLHRATNLPSTKQGKEKELIHVIDALRSNNYPQNVISNILKKKSSPQRTNPIPTPEELVCMFFKWVAPSEFSSYAVLPYINGISQPLTRLLKKHDIRVVSKPFKTLQQEFPSPKSRPPIDLQPNVVYKISCADCPWSYVGVANFRINVGCSIGNKSRGVNDIKLISGFWIYHPCLFYLKRKGKRSRSKKSRDLRGVGSLSAMAFCGYSKYVGGDCGESPDRPATDQVVRIGDCSNDIKGHLKTCGVSESALNSEARLQLARAGSSSAEDSNLSAIYTGMMELRLDGSDEESTQVPAEEHSEQYLRRKQLNKFWKVVT